MMMLLNTVTLMAVWVASAVCSTQSSTCPVGGDASIVANDGTSVGTEVVVDGVTLYITMPPPHAAVTNTAVLYLTDVFGINLTENRLLADSFARAGFVTVAPDLFNGQPAPSDLNDPTFNTTAFLAAHGPDVTDPVINTAIEFINNNLNTTKLAVTGYCFGGRYSFRFTDPARSLKADVAFAAHPSAWEDEEVSAIGAPTAVAAADGDSLMPPSLRAELEALLLNISSPYQLSLYSGVEHGFGVRANVSDPVQKFAKETAFLQAVRWFTSF
ncbi:dienelactone hydrolase family-domain-containing protein [Coniella lustricola]|uniref:Dienelactone hydrolase family-domain-containing protein n=1 Tax=Coniella lustricola TaxID=2025994 RepID=A0A2T2ZXK8_9PEZI|nr:dienelactone hydrolase family-domain-containing protein [Coniella lustricola]